jgi:DNA-binding transcriptional regulator YbjK
LIADTAIEILAEVGAGGLTHRVVDVQARLPPGTTSNFYRTRLALLRAAAERVAEVHWQYVAELKARITEPLSRAGLAKLLSTLVDSADPTARARNLARFELFLEGNRQPELRPILEEVYAAAMEAAAAVLGSAGVQTAPEKVRSLARLLNGLAFDRLASPGPALTPAESTMLVDRLLELVFGEPRR